MDQKQKLLDRARDLVWRVREGKDTSVYKSAFDYAKTLIEVEGEARRLREQVAIHRRYLKLVITVLNDVQDRAFNEDTLPSSDLTAITKLMDEATRLLKESA